MIKRRMTTRKAISYSIDDLLFLKILGSGGFGDVYLTKNTKFNKLYALKCISKEKIVEQELEKNI